MMDIEEKQETGASLMVLGLGVWLMDLLVMFFLPSAAVYGHRTMFLGIIATMGLVGLILLVTGFRVRGWHGSE